MQRRPFLGLLPATLVSPLQSMAQVQSQSTLPPQSKADSPSRSPPPASALSQSRAPSQSPALSATTAAENSPLGVTHRPLVFPADHGSHPDTHVEWWYVTGWLRSGPASASNADARDDAPPELGFQVTFFRTRTGLAADSASRFAARQLVFAHVALTDLTSGAKDGGTLHDQRVARQGFGIAQTPGPSLPQVVKLHDWSLQRLVPVGTGDLQSRLRIDVRADRFALALDLAGTQPLVLQGDAGYSQKGPDPAEASHYYSEPQLAVRGRVERVGAPARDVSGRAWLDHEWSDQYLAIGAVGWDWVGFNLADGAALMAFRLRRADGSAAWAGGSYRGADGQRRNFAAGEVRFEPLRRWISPRTKTSYPVEWLLTTPSGRWRVAALQDDQELDSRGSTGAIYWEGLSALRTEDGRIAGWGYLELTGYAGQLRL
ncbi:MAG TPA: carotenoid 1,2-hydratase [Burkholderiaceae bacterium]